MTKRKILALIDSENLYYAPKKIWGPGSKLDYKKLYRVFTKKEADTQAIAYLVSDPVVDQHRFIECLVKMGYTPKIKTLYPDQGQIQNSNWDDEIIEDGLKRIDDVDELFMVSGDSDFIPLLAAYKERFKPVSVVCFKDNFNYRLRDFADLVIFLDQNILMNQRPIPIRQPSYPRPRVLPGCRFPMQ